MQPSTPTLPGFVVAIVLLILSGFWLLFPIIIWQQLKAIAKTLARIESAIEGVERNTRQPGNGRAESAVRYSERH
jgi:uncharacterized protein YoxC